MADLTLTLTLIRRLRPREGWLMFLLALVLVISIQQLAAWAQINLSWQSIGAAALVGLLLGRLLGRWQWAARRWLQGVHWAVIALVLLGGGTFWVFQSGKVLPPTNLLWRDIGTLGRTLTERPTPTPTATVTPTTEPTPVPQPIPVAPAETRWDSIAFLQASLPRFWQELQTAPNRGAAGARMIVEVTGVLLAWSGLLILGIGLGCRGRLAGWSFLAVVALITIKLLGGGSGYWLVTGLAIVLLLVLLNEAARREESWLARKLDYATDLRLDAAVWGGTTLVVVLALAVILPFTFNSNVAQWLWSWIEPPSGIAALERTISENDGPRPDASKAKVAGSTLPSIELGRSLEAGPPQEEALRVHVNQPLLPGPQPTYWRSRILTIYNGSAWYTNAQVVPDRPLDIPAGTTVDMVVQDIEDRRSDRQLIYGLPDIIGVNVPSNGERLPDGTLAATTLNDIATQYRVFSHPPTVAVPAARPDQQPNLTPYLQLPPDLPPRVVDLARTVTRDTRGTNDTALALERYLRELPYSYEVAPLPDQGDGVDQFLFSMRQGYCTYYASAFAVLARSLGIPARVSLGYATGNYDAATQTYTVFEGDAHAWPELYIDGRWVAFEPTPVRPLPARDGTQQQPQAVPVAPAPELPPSRTLWDYWPGALLVLALLLAVLFPWLPRLRPDHSSFAIQRQLEQRGTRAGIPWPPGATLNEYAALLRPHVGMGVQALDTLVGLIEQERYSGQKLSSDQQGRLLLAWTTLKGRIGKEEGLTATRGGR